jgi:hypothetical protein
MGRRYSGLDTSTNWRLYLFASAKEDASLGLFSRNPSVVVPLVNRATDNLALGYPTPKTATEPSFVVLVACLLSAPPSDAGSCAGYGKPSTFHV